MLAILCGIRDVNYKKKDGTDVSALEVHFIIEEQEGITGNAVKSFYLNPNYTDSDIYEILSYADPGDVFDIGFMQNKWGNDVLYKAILSNHCEIKFDYNVLGGGEKDDKKT